MFFQPAQNIFPDSPVLRLLSRNLTGLVLFAFKADQASVKRLSHRLFPSAQKWFLQSYEHATSVTRGGYLYVDTSNNTGLKDKFRVRNFIAPVYGRPVEAPPKGGRTRDEDPEREYLTQPIRSLAKKGHQFLYADPAESPTH